MLKIAIVGGGCSGVLAAMAIMREVRCPLGLTICEPSRELAKGVAYSTTEEYHLLNVPAIRMGAWADDIQDFFNWIATNQPGVIAAGDFAPRKLYLRYITERFSAERAKRPDDLTFEQLQQRVVEVSPRDGGSWLLRGELGTELSADIVVLSLGLPEVRWPSGIRGLTEAQQELPEGFSTSVWGADGKPVAALNLKPDARVLLLGSGLTAVDGALSLRHHGVRGQIAILSRRGKLPSVHFDGPPSEPAEFGCPVSSDLRTLVRQFRKDSERYRWDAVIDAIRARIPEMWGMLSLSEKMRFLRHLQPFWDTHRHRMAPTIGREIASLISRGDLNVEAGRLVGVGVEGGLIRATIRTRHQSETHDLLFDRIVNCTGFGALRSDSYGGVLSSLIHHNIVSLDSTGLGIRYSVNPADACPYRATPGLYVMGPLLRAMRWESIAVPELREQARTIASDIASSTASLPAVD